MVYELEKEHKKSSLMCKKKEELVKEIMRLEHNVNVMNERLNVQANAIKHYEQESRNKAIEEFAERLKPIIDGKIKGWTNSDDLRRWCKRSIEEIAEELRCKG